MDERHLTKRAREIFAQMQQMEGWVSRGELARSLRSKQLTHYDTDVLNSLRDLGFIEISEQECNSPSGKRWAYRALKRS